MRLLLGVLSLITLLSFQSCKQRPADQRSETKFGHLRGWQNSTILSALPGETLYVCGHGISDDLTDLAIKALNEWTSVTKMSEGLTIKKECRYGTPDAKVQVELGACTLQGVVAQTFPVKAKGWRVIICDRIGQSYDIMLHEIGHVFGQCDRYSDSKNIYHPSQGGNCETSHGLSDGKFEIPSAMQAGGPGHPQKVTEDDIKGFNALLNRSDVSGAAEWRDFITNGKKTSRPSETPSEEPDGSNENSGI